MNIKVRQIAILIRYEYSITFHLQNMSSRLSSKDSYGPAIGNRFDFPFDFNVKMESYSILRTPEIRTPLKSLSLGFRQSSYSYDILRSQIERSNPIASQLIENMYSNGDGLCSQL
jgi:hypothetical protein